jgi:hypothetical protein
MLVEAWKIFNLVCDESLVKILGKVQQKCIFLKQI